jgi:hypothetical protein
LRTEQLQFNSHLLTAQWPITKLAQNNDTNYTKTQTTNQNNKKIRLMAETEPQAI